MSRNNAIPRQEEHAVNSDAALFLHRFVDFNKGRHHPTHNHGNRHHQQQQQQQLQQPPLLHPTQQEQRRQQSGPVREEESSSTSQQVTIVLRLSPSQSPEETPRTPPTVPYTPPFDFDATNAPPASAATATRRADSAWDVISDAHTPPLSQPLFDSLGPSSSLDPPPITFPSSQSQPSLSWNMWTEFM